MGHHQLDTLDEQILKLIADNARIPFLEVARACNVSGAAIHQRIQKLTNLGILKGSEYVIDPEKIGYETCAYIGIYLKDPASFDAVTRALEAIPEIVECHFTIIDECIRAGMLLICGMGLPAFFLPYSRSDFGKVGIHLRGFCIHLGQAEGTCKGECLAINACTADDVDVFVGLATVQCFFQ